MIFRGSRYAGLKYTALVDQDGRVRKYLHARTPLRVSDLRGDFTVAAKKSGDELDAIVARSGGRERQWWAIAEVSGVEYPFNIEDGSDLIVPGREVFARM